MATATELQPIAEPVAPPIVAEAPADPPVSYIRRRFNVAEYYKMAEAGVFAPGERVELIDGDVVPMSPMGRRHSSKIGRLNGAFYPLYGRALVWIQQPLNISDRTEPEPDLMLLRPRDDFYEAHHPMPPDVLLLVEVMDSSSPYDRGFKLGLYARSGVPEVWLVDIPGRQVETYRRPVGGLYTEIAIRSPGESVAPEAFPEFVVAIDAILG